MAVTSATSRLFFRNQSRAKVPFGSEVRNFIAESSKCQTLFANCEGCYRRRIDMHQKEEILKEFIYNTMFCREFPTEVSDFKTNDGHDMTDDEDDKEILVANICKEMISLSRKFNLNDQIHFSVIWVYYFDYKMKKGMSVPVFKIFKTKSGSEAVILDVSLKSYESWDCYSETAEYPESLLCYPRHGEYSFDCESNLLLLEFVRPGRVRTNGIRCRFDELPKAPFSQLVIRPLFSFVSKLKFHKKVKEIKQLISTFCSYIRGFSGAAFNLAVFALLFGIKLKDLGGLKAFNLKTIANQAFMLLNVVLHAGDLNQFRSLNYWSDLKITSLPSFSSLSDVQTAFLTSYSEGAHLFELLKSSQKDWFKILKSFCSLFRKSSDILNAVLYFAPDSLITKLLFGLLKVIEGITGWVSTLESPGTENFGSEAAKNFGKNVTGTTPALESSSSSDIEKQSQWCLASSAKTQNTLECFRQIFCDKIFSNLSLLETSSTTQICNQISDEASELLKKRPVDASAGRFGVLIGVVNGYGIYLFSRASLPHLTSVFRRLLNTDFSFQPKETCIFDVIDHSEKKLGTLFFPLEFTAIGFFPIDAFGEIGNAYNFGATFLGSGGSAQRDNSRISPIPSYQISGGSDSYNSATY